MICYAVQLAEADQQYAEIYEEYEKAREFYAKVEAEMRKASETYLRDKRQWAEATAADARARGDLQKQLDSERAARDAAEAALAAAQVGSGLAVAHCCTWHVYLARICDVSESYVLLTLLMLQPPYPLPLLMLRRTR